MATAKRKHETINFGDQAIQCAQLKNTDGTAVDLSSVTLIESSSATVPVAGTAAILDSSGDLRTASNTGTAGTGVTAVEYGDGRNHVTVLTVATTLPAIAGGANLAVGNLLYTLPAGVQVIDAANMSLAITQADGNITADTPDGGLGTVIGSGVVAVLGGTATFEDILIGQTFNDCNGTAETVALVPTAGAGLIRNAGDAKTIHFNVADGWAASGDTGAALTGTVTIAWRTLG